MIATIELLDEVNCKIRGLETSTNRKLNKKFSYLLPHARHTPAFKMGRWDGKEVFYTMGGLTYINLLEEILPILIADGYEVAVEDKRQGSEIQLNQIDDTYFASKVWPKGHPVEGQPIVLREHQMDVVNKCLEMPQSVAIASTSAGKTLITAALSSIVEDSMPADENGNPARTIVIVPNKSLVVQTFEDYENLGLDVGVYFGDKKEFGKTHTICTWQSLEAIQKRFRDGESDYALSDFIEGVQAVICDEVHQAKAAVLRKMLSGPMANIPIRWGLTGTVPKDISAEVSIRCSIGPISGKITAKELQDKGILSTCDISILQLKDDVFYDNYPDEASYLSKNENRIAFVADMINSLKGNTLVLVDKLATGQIMTECFDELGKEVKFVSGSTKQKDRKAEYDKFADENDRILVATFGVAAVGISITRIENVIIYEPGKSFVKVIQSIGRGLRKGHDKDHVNIYDICSNAKFSKRHLTQRKKFYKEAEYPFKVIKVDWRQK